MAIRPINLILALSFTLAIGLSAPLTAAMGSSETAEEKFEKAYAAYLEEDNQYKRRPLALEAYKWGRQVYGDDHVNTANLILNAVNAGAYGSDRSGKRERTKQMEYARNIYAAEYAATDLQMMDVWLASIDAQEQQRKNDYYGRKLLELADHHHESDALLANQIRFEAGKALLKAGSPESRILVRVNRYFTEQLPPEDSLRIESHFYLARYYAASNANDEAIEAFTETLTLSKGLEEATSRIELYSRAQLVGLLEQSGRSEEATEHCVQIGALTPWSSDQEPEPLYRRLPEYPRGFTAAHSGTVQLEFDITEDGFVENVNTLNYDGPQAFVREAKKALQSWRYAPKFKNNQPITAVGQRVQIDFNAD